jgi:hypothetical protein
MSVKNSDAVVACPGTNMDRMKKKKSQPGWDLNVVPSE